MTRIHRRRSTTFFLALALFPILTLSFSSALAATIHVPADYVTIQGAIDAALGGGLVLVAPGTYMENLAFLGKAIEARSEAGAAATIIDGSECTRGEDYCSVVEFLGGTEAAVLDGFTIRNGSGQVHPYLGGEHGGGIFCYEASPTIKGCTITGNTTYVAGGIHLFESNSLIENCSIIGNVGRGGGGGIDCWESTPAIRNCTISGNSTEGDGGGVNLGISDPLITNCNITDNFADETGGGLMLWYSSPTIEDSAVSRNTARSYGGGICGVTESSPTIRNCDITDNRADRQGGGCFFNGDCLATIENCSFSRNKAENTLNPYLCLGGGIYLSGQSNATISNCTISENSTINMGGGISSEYSSPTITNCTIFGNSAMNDGGGIILYGASYTPTITNSTIARNVSGGLGGGIRCKNLLNLTMINSIVWGNFAPAGPELALIDDSTLTVSYSDVQGGELAIYVEESTLSWLEGNIDADPLFMGTDDYHLSLESPCIDIGASDAIHDDQCFPPSMGTEQNDMGAYGGPGACDWCGDHDGDGYYSAACGGTDCSDRSSDVYPGAEEVCDGRDNDCNGQIDEGFEDVDGDGWASCVDCDDSDPVTHPGAEETCDGIDNDCDGWIDEDFDQDGDGWTSCAEPVPDCDDFDYHIYPGKDEVCDNGIDDDCDALVDFDDPECEYPYTLELDAYHEASRLYLDFTLGTPVPATWKTYFISLVFPTQIIPLWSFSLPVINPPVSLPINFYFPWVGSFFVYSGLFTSQGLQAYALDWDIAGGDG